MAMEVKEFCPVEIYNLVTMQRDGDDDGAGSIEGKKEKRSEMKKLLAREAMREWQESVKELERRVERLAKWIAVLTNDIFQLTGLYGLFIGVLFSMVQLDSDRRRVHCQHLWGPAALCILVWAITTFVIDKKFIEIRCIRYHYIADQEKSEQHKMYLEELTEMGHSRFNSRIVEENKVTELESQPPLTRACGKELESITKLKEVVENLESNSRSNSCQPKSTVRENTKSLEGVAKELKSKTDVNQAGGRGLQRITRRLNEVMKDLDSESHDANVAGRITSDLKQESYLRCVVLAILAISTLVPVASFVHILCFTADSPACSCEGGVNWPDYAPAHDLP